MSLNIGSYVKASRNVLLQMYSRSRAAKRIVDSGRANMIDTRRIQDNIKSDTLFVLGSGESILDFGDLEWSVISKCTSLGINLWVYHDFVPDIAVIEWYPNDEVSYLMADAFNTRKYYYQNVNIIRKDIDSYTNVNEFDYIDQINNISLVNEIALSTTDIDLLNAELKVCGLIGLTSLKSGFTVVPQARATIVFSIFMGVRLGFKNIVLCGVDLNGSKYFYHSDKWINTYNLIVPPIDNIHEDTHETMLTKNGISVVDVIKVVENEINRYGDVNIYVSNPKSALADVLDVYEFSS